MRRKGFATLLMSCLVTLLCFTPAAFAAGALDGKTYEGTVKMGKGKSDPDTFIFKDGKFHSTACDQYGYTETPYTTSGKGKKLKFKATATNTNGAKMVWNGHVSGATISGTANMVDGKKTTKGSFHGKVKKTA